MKKISSKVSAVCAVILAAAAFVSCGSSKKSEKVSFVLDWTPNTNHTGIYVAQEKGFFAEEGLEVEIVQPNQDSTTMMIASGRAQFGVSFQDTVAPGFAKEDKIPVTAVAAILQHNTSGLVALKAAGINRPALLEGKRYATWDSPVELETIRLIMKNDGGNFDKVTLVHSTVYDVITALNTEIDSVWIYWAWDGIALENAGYDVDFLDFGKLDPVLDFYSPVIIANNDYLKKNPEQAKRFLKAVRRGYEYAIENPEDAAAILCKAAPELDEALVKASQKWIKDEYKAEAEKWGYIDSARWNRYFNWLNGEKLVEGTIPENYGFSNDYLN